MATTKKTKLLVCRTQAAAENAVRALDLGDEWRAVGIIGHLTGERFDRIVVMDSLVSDSEVERAAIDRVIKEYLPCRLRDPNSGITYI